MLCLSLDMSRFISTLLAKEKNILESTLGRLEEATGHVAVDAKLTSDIVIKSKAKMRELGLDPDNTTGSELYHGLMNLISLHDGFLAKNLGINEANNPSEVIPKVAKVISKVASGRQVWALRHSVAKRLLKEHTPKQLMKQLGYRSLESMLKRESIDELFAGAKMVESDDWMKDFHKSFSKLHPSDFEQRKIIVKQPSVKRWVKLSNSYMSKNRNNIIELKELGSIVILPMDDSSLPGITMALMTKALHNLNELKLYSGYLKFIQVQDNFGKIVSDSLIDGPMSHANMAGEDLHWRVIQSHLSKASNGDMFEPHVQSEDLNLEPVEETLFKFEPALHFWYGTSSLGLPYDSYSVSLNIADMATNYINQLPAEKSSSFYLQESLWDEILKRYLLEEPLQDQVLQQLDNIMSQEEYSSESIGGVAIA